MIHRMLRRFEELRGSGSPKFLRNPSNDWVENAWIDGYNAGKLDALNYALKIWETKASTDDKYPQLNGHVYCDFFYEGRDKLKAFIE